jgi:hypothetical protein
MSKQRETFEAWFAGSKLGPRRSEADWNYHAAWEAWQASRAAALEEAEKECEAERLEGPIATANDLAYENAIGDCLRAIRELKEHHDWS